MRQEGKPASQERVENEKTVIYLSLRVSEPRSGDTGYAKARNAAMTHRRCGDSCKSSRRLDDISAAGRIGNIFQGRKSMCIVSAAIDISGIASLTQSQRPTLLKKQPFH